jgi:hypothetical protein
MFVSVVLVLYRNSVFRCFDSTETKQRTSETNRKKQKLIFEKKLYQEKVLFISSELV